MTTAKPVTAVEANVRDNLLIEAAERNLPADLMVVRGENLQADLKCRFLRCESERVLMSVPTHDGHPVILQPGQFVEVYFHVGPEQFGFDATTIGYTRVPADGQESVEAIGLSPPHFLERRQRRRFYRVSVASLAPIDAAMWPTEPGFETLGPIQAKLCNLSAGGVALMPNGPGPAPFAAEQRYRVCFVLPGLDGEFEFDAVVCHVRHVFQNRRQILGLAFVPGDDPVAHRRELDRIGGFVAEQQRKHLGQVQAQP